MDAIVPTKWVPQVCNYRNTRITDKEKAKKQIHFGYKGPVHQADMCYPVSESHSAGSGKDRFGTVDCPMWDLKHNPN